MEDVGAVRLASLLQELEGAIRHAGLSQVLDRLRPGIPEEQTRNAFRAAGLHAPKEVQAWFAWHDGSVEARQIIPGRWFVPQEDALRNYVAQEKGSEWGEWRPGWVEIVTSAPPQVTVYCGDPDRELAPVQEFDSQDGGFDRESRYAVIQPSLCIPVTWWIEHFREGIYALGSDGEWDFNRRVSPERRYLS